MTDEVAEFFLIGDSHSVAIGDAALAAGRHFVGGPIGIGRMLEKPFWSVEDGRFRLTTEVPEAFRAGFEGLLSFPGPVICAVGFNARRFGRDLHDYLAMRGAKRWPEAMSRQSFEHCVRDARQVAISFYRLLAAHHRDVYFAPSPQRTTPDQRQTLFDFEAVLIPEITATGATLIDVRDQLEDDGTDIAQRFRRPDDIAHGSAAYGKLLLDEFERLRRRSGR